MQPFENAESRTALERAAAWVEARVTFFLALSWAMLATIAVGTVLLVLAAYFATR